MTKMICKICGGPAEYQKQYCPHCLDVKERKRVRTVAKSMKAVGDKYKDKLRGKGCFVCGYNKTTWALEFHHLNRYKLANVSKIRTISRMKKEILNTNLVVLCSNCHREVHAGLIDESSLLDGVLTC